MKTERTRRAAVAAQMQGLKDAAAERSWRVTGTKHGKLVTVIVQAKDHNAAVTAGSKGKHLLVVRDCVLVREGA